MRKPLAIQQGRIHGYSSRVRVGRGSDGGESHWGIWAGAVSPKRLKTPKKSKIGTNQQTDKAGCRVA